ncbi:Crp/Fnr family transcriptional regulator [Bacillus sp. 3255]|uniref:Crp/Fnr family transcriptional regulator n=1 Tax=Bacillus sp. 3255 TaxID=2817904 RepID=UPI00285682CD|nr:Crp/Fnr family transcriptional regulator [Bacillus sp. 3255]MDR6881314.1 CRP/FNR family transcriptional regulator [Bacillus sp. 3255]
MNVKNNDAGEILRQVPLFRDLTEGELEGVRRIMIQRSYRKKSVVFTEGSEKEAVYFIQSGLIKTYKTDENGHQQIVSFLKTGDMFPHTGLFHANHYPATAETIVPTTLLAMPIKPFEIFLSHTPGIAVKLLRVMSEKILELQGKLQELTGQDVQNRGQLFLLKLAETNGRMSNGRLLIEIPMTHQDIANAIGTTRETVNRLLNHLRRDGIVETDRSGFVIHDIEALRHWREQ